MFLLRTIISISLIQSALSAPATSPSSQTDVLTLNSIIQTSNFSRLDLLPPANVSASGGSNGNCASSYKYPTWTAPGWNVQDCWSAVQQVYLEEVWSKKEEPCEFVGKGASATKPQLCTVRTPRKYIKRTCVLTIMMLDWFLPGQLPDGRVVTQQKTDVSTYDKIYKAARAIETECTDKHVPGWALLGDASAMGVFIWATNSPIDELTGGFPVLSSSSVSNTTTNTAVE